MITSVIRTHSKVVPHVNVNVLSNRICRTHAPESSPLARQRTLDPHRIVPTHLKVVVSRRREAVDEVLQACDIARHLDAERVTPQGLAQDAAVHADHALLDDEERTCHACTCACTCVCTPSLTHTHTHTHTHAHTYTPAYRHTRIHSHTHTHARRSEPEARSVT